MNSYNISPTINPNRVFILQKSELEKRWNPLYYASNVFKFLKTTNFDIKTVSEISEYTISGFGVGKEAQDSSENGFIQIRPTNLDELGNLKFDRNVFLDESYLESKKSNIIKRNDILFNNTNSQELVGKTAFFDLEGIYFHSNHITRIRVNENVIRPKFLWILLNLYQEKKIFYTLCTNWNNQSGVGTELLNSIKLIIPSFEIQDKIIQIKEDSLNHKRQNEAEAEKLLASIDAYLLGALGITLPTPQENTLKNRIFTTQLSEVSGGRFDPKLYSQKTKDLISSIYKTKYNHSPLKLIVIQSFAGDWGNDDNETYDNDDFVRCLVIRATEFDNKFNLNVDGSRAKFRLINKLKYQNLDIQTNDLLIEKSGGSDNQPVGRISILTKDLTENYVLGYSNFIHKLRVDSSKVTAEYVFSYLKTLHNIKITDVMQSQTNGIKNLILNEYLKLPIPIPPLDKQQEIADHITAIRQQAQQLKDKTKDLLAKASSEIEEILLN